MSLTLRTALAGAAASTAALTVPAVAAVGRQDHEVMASASAQERFEYHFAEMANALNELSAHASGWRLKAGADHGGKAWRDVGALTYFSVPVPGAALPAMAKGGAA